MQTAPSCPHGTETTIQRLSPLDSKPGHVAVCLLDCISSFQFDHTQHLPLQTALITLVYFLHSDKIHKISSYVDLTRRKIKAPEWNINISMIISSSPFLVLKTSF